MKILYAVQGTGNGHISRAMALLPALEKLAHVDVLVSGCSHDLPPPFPVRFSLRGLSFSFGKKGGIDFAETYRKTRLKRFIKEVKDLDLSEYDFVVNDFEPVSSRAAIRQKKLCIGFSNQAVLFADNVPAPASFDLAGKLILRYFAPCRISMGVHYRTYNPRIFTPLIAPDIRSSEVWDGGFYLVYLPAYSLSRIVKCLAQLPREKFVIFSQVNRMQKIGNFTVWPVSREHFVRKLASCSGVITAAGFATTSEALFLNKKLLVVPQKQQIEQKCNAYALRLMGVTVMKSLRKKHFPVLESWVRHGKAVNVVYRDNADKIAEQIVLTARRTMYDKASYFRKSAYKMLKPPRENETP